MHSFTDKIFAPSGVVNEVEDAGTWPSFDDPLALENQMDWFHLVIRIEQMSRVKSER